MTTQAPSGTVTFMLTDLESSTRMWEQEPTVMKAAMVRHDEILEKTIAGNQGFVFSRMGDGMRSRVRDGQGCCSAASAFQQALGGSPGVLQARCGPESGCIPTKR